MQDPLANVDPASLTPAALAGGTIVTYVLAIGLVIDIVLLVRLFVRRPDWRGWIDRARSQPWTWREATFLLVMMLFLHTVLLLGLHAASLFTSFDPATSVTPILIQTVLFHGTGLALILYLMRLRSVSWGSGFGWSRRAVAKQIGTGLLLYVAAMPAVVAAALAYRAVLLHLGVDVSPQDVVALFVDPQYPPWLKIYLVVLAVTVAPVAEELLFRGIALPVLLKVTPAWVTICCVSLLFAMLHFHVPSLAPLFTIATAFALAYLYSGAILVPITMHVLFNGVSLTILFLMRDTLLAGDG